MKKKLAIIIIFFFGLLISGIVINGTLETPKENYDEDVINDIMLSMLMPYISEAVYDYYGEPKQYALNDAKIILAERLPIGQFYFEIIIQVISFEGAHNPSYGLETITIRKDYSGINVINFKHEDYPIEDEK